MKKILERIRALGSRGSSRLVAGAVALPFVLALPGYVDAGEPWRNVGLAAVVAAIFLGTQLAAHRVAAWGHGRLALVFALLYAALGAIDWAGTTGYAFAHAITDLALLYLVFLASAAVSRYARPAGKVALALLLAVLFVSAIVQAMHVHIFGFAIDDAGYRAIFQSSAAEALEFGSHYLTAGPVAAAAAMLAIALAAALAAPPLPRSAKALLLGGVLALAAVPVLGENALLVVSRLAGVAEAVNYAGELIEFRALRRKRSARKPDVAVTQEGPLAGKPQTYVFIIGESLTRNHMSLYGYWRETTPALSRLAREMAVFTDVVSPHSHTEQSLELALTLANQSNKLRFADASNYSLIELLRAAGFTTWWISNQNSFGPWDNKTALLAHDAEHVHFSGTRSGAIVSGPLDEVLLEPYAAALRDPAPRKAIFLHFLGSHWDYSKRYPPDAAIFGQLPTEAEIGTRLLHNRRLHQVNDYDNSVRYHDRLAARVIEMLRATGQAAAVLLFSDHGENLYGMKAHHWKYFTHDHVEVPLALWFSPEYARVAGGTAERARRAARLPFALEDLPHLVADVAGLRSAALRPERSPLSAAYRTPAARALFEGSLVYEAADEPLLNVRRKLRRIAHDHPRLQGAIWAHRVNTLGKMMEAAPLFDGTETDVLYDPVADALLVNHPPAPPSGLTLDELLGYANRLNPGLTLWLDVKNLDEANAAQVVERLRRLDARHAIRGRAVVETGHTGPAAGLLRSAGFRSSYYLPTEVVTQRQNGCRDAARIQRVVDEGRFAAVSYDWRGRQWVESCLGRFVREHGLRAYAWDLAPDLSQPPARDLLDEERLRAYAGVSAVLLRYSSVFDDWPEATGQAPVAAR